MQSRSRPKSRSAKRPRTKTKSTKRSLSYSSVGRRTVALAAPTVGLGTSATTVLRTSFFTNVTAAAGTGIFTGYLKPGSAFDPTGDLANVQPQMYDAWFPLYTRYKVNSCTIKMKITGVSAAVANASVWVAASYPAVDSTALATYQAAASQQYCKTASGGFQIANAIGVGAEGKMITHRLNHDSIVGAKSDTWDIGGAVNADPTNGQYMVLPIFLQGALAGAHIWVLEVDIFQNVTFSQKKNAVDA